MEDLKRYGVPESLWGWLCNLALDRGAPVRTKVLPSMLVLYLPPGNTRPVPEVMGAIERQLQHLAWLAGVDLCWQRTGWRGGYLTIGLAPEGWLLQQVLACGRGRARRLAAMRKTT